MNWIQSAGGPLICLETGLASAWCGTDGTSKEGVCVPARPTDYERACAVTDYVGVISVGSKQGLVFGDMPLSTTVYVKTPSELYVVRAVYMEPDANIAEFTTIFADGVFRSPVETINFVATSEAISIFDSAMPGSYSRKEVLEFRLQPGRYNIKTVLIEPDEQTSLVLHRFGIQA